MPDAPALVTGRNSPAARAPHARAIVDIPTVHKSLFEFLPLARLAIAFRLNEVTHGRLCNSRTNRVCCVFLCRRSVIDWPPLVASRLVFEVVYLSLIAICRRGAEGISPTYRRWSAANRPRSDNW